MLHNVVYLHGLQRIRSSQLSQSILLVLRGAGRPAALGLDMQAVQLDPDVALDFGPHLWLRARVPTSANQSVRFWYRL